MEFLFVGNVSWIDFVNTMPNGGAEPFRDFESLLTWSVEANLIDIATKRAISKASSNSARERAFRDALALRTDLRRAGERMLRGEGPGSALISRVNTLLRDHPRVIQIRRVGGSWQTLAEDVARGPSLPLAAIAEDFGEFLESADLGLLRRCEKDSCPILFYDTSRNHARRWCSMQLCGNRTKVARHRARQSNDLDLSL